MKKIGIHTGNVSYGGQEKMLVEFLKILDQKKYQVKLFIEEDKGKENIYEQEIPQGINYKFLIDKIFMEKLEKIHRNRDFISKLIYSYMLIKKKNIAIEKLREEIKELDLIIDYDMGLIRNIHKLNGEHRIIGWSHAGEGNLFKNKTKNINIKKYKDIVVINEKMLIGYKKNFSNSNIRFHKIYNFMDCEVVIDKSKEIIRENLGSYILSIGSLTKNKNHSFLIKSFSNYIKKYKNDTINLVIIGDGIERKNLEKIIKDLNLERRVYLLGKKLNPYPYIKKSEMYIQPSLEEGFPVVIMEAMILGKVVISSKTNGGLEILENGKYGLLYENEEELIKNINLILNNRELKENYEKKILIKSLDFEKERIKNKIEELIDRDV